MIKMKICLISEENTGKVSAEKRVQGHKKLRTNYWRRKIHHSEPCEILVIWFLKSK